MSASCCDLCGKDLNGEKWILLNRFGYGTGTGRGMTECLNSDWEYHWDVGDDLDAQSETVTGTLLCYPSCLLTWIDGKMIAADFELRKRRS